MEPREPHVQYLVWLRLGHEESLDHDGNGKGKSFAMIASTQDAIQTSMLKLVSTIYIKFINIIIIMIHGPDNRMIRIIQSTIPTSPFGP